jgi:hypothetical protein
MTTLSKIRCLMSQEADVFDITSTVTMAIDACTAIVTGDKSLVFRPETEIQEGIAQEYMAWVTSSTIE